MTYQKLFDQVKTKFMKANVSGVKDHLAFQFNITGEAAGTFYAELRDGELHVEPYEYHDRDAAFTCSAETLLGLADGKIDPIAAFTLGRLKVDGSIEKALMVKEFLQA